MQLPLPKPDYVRNEMLKRKMVIQKAKQADSE